MLTKEQLPANIQSLVAPQAQNLPTLRPPQQEAPAQQAPVNPAPADPSATFGPNPAMRQAMQKAGFGGQVAQQMDKNPAPQEPGGWAKSILASAQQVLAGVGDVSTEPTNQPGSKAGSFFEGLAQTTANRNLREEKAKQQEFENERKLKQEEQNQQQLNQQKLQSDATIAYNNAERIKTERLTHQLGDQEIEAGIKYDEPRRAELEADHAQVIHKDKTWNEYQQIISEMDASDPNHPITLIPIATGRKVVGKDTIDGKEVPVYSTTYSLYSAPEKQKLTQAMADRFNKALNPTTPYHEGDELYGHQVDTLNTEAKAAATDLAADKKLAVEMLGSERAEEIFQQAQTPEFNKQYHDALVEFGYANPDKVIDSLEKKGVENAQELVAMRYGGPDILKEILDQKNRLEIEKERQAQAAKTDDKIQNQLEQQYRQVLLRPLANRSGGLGLEDAKVNQAIHLSGMMDQYKQKDGTFHVPQAQYMELVLGLARLISPTGVPTQDTVHKLESATAKGDISGALSYLLGTPLTGNTQAIIKNLAESIDRQGFIAQQNRDGYMDYLRGLAPTSLDPDRIQRLEKGTLNEYKPIFQEQTTGTPVVVNGVRFPDQASADRAMAAWQAQQAGAGQQNAGQQAPQVVPEKPQGAAGTWSDGKGNVWWIDGNGRQLSLKQAAPVKVVNPAAVPAFNPSMVGTE